MTTYKLIHLRDPDEGCEIRLFVDDVEVDFDVEDIDPGRGYKRDHWDDRIAEYDGDDSNFGKAALEALENATDSPYIDEED